MLSGEVVTLVAIPRFLPVIVWPSLGEYDHPKILETIPCEKRGDRYFNLKSGQEVVKTDDMLEWKNLSGSVFRYKSDHGYSDEYLLISRRFENGKLVLLSLGANEITNSMMLRTVKKRKKDK